MLKDEMTMKKKIIEYFKTVTPEQLKIDLEKANYSVLKDVQSYTLAPMYIKQTYFEFSYELTNEDIIISSEVKYFRNFEKLSSRNDNYDYDLAA